MCAIYLRFIDKNSTPAANDLLFFLLDEWYALHSYNFCIPFLAYALKRLSKTFLILIGNIIKNNLFVKKKRKDNDLRERPTWRYLKFENGIYTYLYV